MQNSYYIISNGTIYQILVIHVITSYLKKYYVPIPTTEKQLAAIVAELDKINELIQLKKQQLKGYDQLAQSIFYEMFGDPVENQKGWEVKKLKMYIK